jgi:DNA-binding transcriptional LysR family regulator
MVMPELSHSFMATYPATEIRQSERHQEALLDGLRRAEIDVAVTYDLQISNDIEFVPLVALPPYALFGESDPFHQRHEVTLSELSTRPMILLDLPISRDYFLGMFNKEGVEPKVAWRSPHLEVVRTMVANGYGYALFNARPKASIALDGKSLFRVSLAGNHPPAVVGLATLRQLKKSGLLEAFESHCRTLILVGSIPGMLSPGDP